MMRRPPRSTLFPYTTLFGDDVVEVFYLFSSEGSIFGTRTVRHAEVRVDPLEVDGLGFVEDVDDVIHVFGSNTHPVHAGVDFHVHAVASPERFGARDGGNGPFYGADRQGERVLKGGGDRGRRNLGEQEDWRGDATRPKFDSLIDDRDREHVGATEEGGLRRQFGAVSVAIGLHDGAEETVPDYRFQRANVVRDRRRRDLRASRTMNALNLHACLSSSRRRRRLRSSPCASRRYGTRRHRAGWRVPRPSRAASPTARHSARASLRSTSRAPSRRQRSRIS